MEPKTGVNDIDAEVPSTSEQEVPAAQEPQSQQETIIPAEKPVEKTYSEADVQELMHKRTKDYADMRSKLDQYSRYGSAEELERRLYAQQKEQKPVEQTAVEADTEEDKAFKQYMAKKYPWVNKMDEIQAKVSQIDAFSDKMKYVESLQGREVQEWNTFASSASGKVAEVCKSAGITDENIINTNSEIIASVIQSNKELYGKWLKRDLSVIDDAIKVIKTSSPFAVKQDATHVAEVKARVGSLPKAMPKGGVSAPTSVKRKLNDEERIEAAFGSLGKMGGSED